MRHPIAANAHDRRGVPKDPVVASCANRHALRVMSPDVAHITESRISVASCVRLNNSAQAAMSRIQRRRG
jgi:hypothetical protein